MAIKTVAGNWKLNKGPNEAVEFIYEFKEMASTEDMEKFILFLPALTLGSVANTLTQENMLWGGQNVYFETSGAFTGENSAKVLKELGATHCLVGHSERRQLFGETDEWMAKKVRVLQDNDIEPMLCVGETLEQREAGKTIEVISHQLAKGLENLDREKPFSIAYEPVWAIGTGKVATPEIAEEAHCALREKLQSIVDQDKAKNTSILYGGSVKPDNAKELGDKPNIDGFLVGGASLDPQSFFNIFVNAMG